MEKLCHRIFVRLEEINKKTDTIIINQGRLNRSLLPNEKRLQKPVNLPPLPVKTEDQLNSLETFLENDENLAALNLTMEVRDTRKRRQWNREDLAKAMEAVFL
ncbi:hypothetical protein DMN91_002190 [Ooceraea biroi]|uniref:Uncharacterized protein n=1 Tax=Ooceraea biroi TaxID=2015173 RepID=A0A3L8E041_OOCBI|nr:hypothetical protein DMN91_002190 [Ooceraea biroi]